jgi:hypothetical protein
MAKGKKKAKQSAEEIEKDRLEAHAKEAINEALEAAESQMGASTPFVEAAEREQSSPTEEGSLKEGQEPSTFEPTGEKLEVSEDELLPEEEKVIVSVVAEKYKDTYIANAKMQGIAGKAARRSNWDWLAQQLAKECLGDKESIDIGKFIAVLEANGVDYSKWTNRNRGWEGRFRMTGRVVLQKVVADSGALKLPDGEMVEAPADWCERFKTKKASSKAAAVKSEAVPEAEPASQF